MNINKEIFFIAKSPFIKERVFVFFSLNVIPMHRAYVLFLSAALVMATACNSGAPREKEKTAGSTAVTTAAPAGQFDLSKTDSIELLHFPDPGNQKVYNNTMIKDTTFIRDITGYVLDTLARKNPCANDFKLYLFRNGDVYKTIYAATGDTCRYFAYVINGVTHFTNLNDSAITILKKYVKP